MHTPPYCTTPTYPTKYKSQNTKHKLQFKLTYIPSILYPLPQPSSSPLSTSYVNLRIWRVFTLASPDCGVPPTSTPFGDDYPFSMKVPKEKLLTLQDMIDMQVGVCCDVMWCAVLYCDVLYCTVLYCAVPYCAALWCAVLICAVLCCDVCCTVPWCNLMCCAVPSCTRPWGLKVLITDSTGLYGRYCTVATTHAVV
jgi:hypothetical protein